MRRRVNRCSGILTGLFSVHSSRSIGTADLSDLRLLIDFCRESGNKILHILPLNEMGPAFNPYEPFSVFALEPMYASLSGYEGMEGIAGRIDRLRQEFPAGRRHFNFSFKEKKFNLLWEIYTRESENGKLDKDRLYGFAEQHAYWLEDFALFKVIGDYQGKKPWYEWDDRYKHRDRETLDIFRREHEKEILFDYWVQMLLHEQLREAADYASSLGVILKGDFSLLVPRNSSDVWANQELFRLEFDAGLPPGQALPAGARFHTPVPDWRKMAEDGYLYLRRRLAYLGQFHKMLRIVHAREISASWAVPWCEPLECSAAHGFYLPEDKRQQERQARRLAAVITENSPAPLSVDNSGLPEGLDRILAAAGVYANFIHRLEKRKDRGLIAPSAYRRRSVAMLSNQDTCAWIDWWDNESGTVDENLFHRLCGQLGLDAKAALERLIDRKRSPPGRLRWKKGLSAKKIAGLLGRPEKEIVTMLKVYKDSSNEREDFRQSLGTGKVPRKPDSRQLAGHALRSSLGSGSELAVNLISDWINAAFPGNGVPGFRINTPYTYSAGNWSMVIPQPLEQLFGKPARRIRSMVRASGRLEAP